MGFPAFLTRNFQMGLRAILMLTLHLLPTSCWQLRTFTHRSHFCVLNRHSAPHMESLAQKMFGTVAEGLEDLAKMAGLDKLGQPDESTGPVSAATPDEKAAAAVADIDARAQSGDLNFNDFLTMSNAFTQMGGNMPGLPGQLSQSQIDETREKFQKHEKIVDVMLEEELADPSLLLEDLKAGGSTPGPRMQRLAGASGLPETEVGLFLMQFEAMRESTRRIAAGEDPDKVTESMSAPPAVNRKQRRAAKAAKKKKKM